MIEFSEFAREKSKKRVVLIVGSTRSPGCCPDEESKSHKIAKRLKKEFSDPVKFEVMNYPPAKDGWVSRFNAESI